ncbi:MAG: carboxypeptidase regulatory-like domain-containing protein [Anaerolineales bacterium]|nr:carboxypeptidase regulatory-like domain-containing protein [Anaerolineales bacterium]MCB8952940.1 carboxypeptidase regulatory-like domain-containing protein [Ardenticatenales bacterium]
MNLRVMDAVLSSQALIVGRITDALTGDALLTSPTLTLAYQGPADEPLRLYPLTPRLFPGGLFVFSASPRAAFPRLAPGDTLDLRLIANAPGYETQEIPFSLTSADLALQKVMRTIGDRQVLVDILNAPVSTQDIALLPQPVHLGGCVVEADDPHNPIPNVRVRVITPENRGPAITDADGFYMLKDMPLAQEISVRARRVGYETITQTIRLDYRQPVNQLNFALNSE